MPQVISVGNMKGGVGKTTTSVHLAQHLGRSGKTLLVDADEELQSALFWRKGDYEGWAFDAIPFAEVTTQAMTPYKYVVMDTKGNEQGNDLVSLAQSSSLLVIPTKPDGLSATGLIRTLTPLIEAGVKNYAVVIVANAGGRGEELREALIGQNVPVMNTIVRQSTAVGDAAERQVPLDGYTSNRYARLVSLDYASVTREVLSLV